MKNLLLIIIGVIFLVLPVSVFAGDGATVYKDGACNVPDGQGGFIMVMDSHGVVTPSENATLTCKAQLPEMFWPDKAYKDSGFLCNTYLGLTNDSRVVITPSGNAILTCQIKANAD